MTKIKTVTETDLGDTLVVRDDKVSVHLSETEGNALIAKDDGLFAQIPTFTNLRGVFVSYANAGISCVLTIKDLLGESVIVGMNRFPEDNKDITKEVIDYETESYIITPTIRELGNYTPYLYFDSRRAEDPEVIFNKDNLTYRNKEFSFPYYTKDEFRSLNANGINNTGADGFRIHVGNALYSYYDVIAGFILINDTGQTHKFTLHDESTSTLHDLSYKVDVSSILPNDGLISSLYLVPIPGGTTSETITKKGDTFEVRYTMKNSQIMTISVPRVSSFLDNT